MRILWIVLGAYGVAGTKPAHVQSAFNVMGDMMSNLDQTSQGPLSIRGTCIKQNAVARLTCIDPLPDGTGWITTLQ